MMFGFKIRMIRCTRGENCFVCGLYFWIERKFWNVSSRFLFEHGPKIEFELKVIIINDGLKIKRQEMHILIMQSMNFYIIRQ